MTQLRKRMLEELQRRDYSQSTARIYLHVISDFAKHFRRSPDTLGPEHIRQYQLHLFHKKLSPYTIRQHTAALRFFFFKTLHRNFRAEYIPFPKFRKRLPTILSPEEVGRLIDSARNLFHRTLIMSSYAVSCCTFSPVDLSAFVSTAFLPIDVDPTYYPSVNNYCSIIPSPSHPQEPRPLPSPASAAPTAQP